MAKCDLCGENTNEGMQINGFSYTFCPNCVRVYNDFVNKQVKAHEIVSLKTNRRFARGLLNSPVDNELDLHKNEFLLNQIEAAETNERLDKIHERLGWLTFIGIILLISLIFVVLRGGLLGVACAAML